MKKRKSFLTGFLYATPSFLTGAGTVMNLAGSYYRHNSSDTAVDADLRALESDFGITGDDIRNAIKEFERETLVSK